MAIYLGSAGAIQLTRTAESSFRSLMDAADVNAGERRFSFDFPSGTFVTGDRLAIRRVNADGSASADPLDFVASSGWGDGQQHEDGTWFASVDPVGGIRLYRSWGDALAGSPSKAVALQAPGSDYWINVSLEKGSPHCIGQVAEYTFSTDRSTVDVTALGDAFEQRWSGLISGSGDLRCFWDWRPSACGDISDSEETAHYLHQLILRQQLGSEFKANLIIKSAGAQPANETLSSLAARAALFYEVTAVITGVAMAFTPDETIESKVEFVTTGPISLRYELPSAAMILQEDNSLILLEDGAGALAQEEVS